MRKRLYQAEFTSLTWEALGGNGRKIGQNQSKLALTCRNLSG